VILSEHYIEQGDVMRTLSQLGTTFAVALSSLSTIGCPTESDPCADVAGSECQGHVGELRCSFGDVEECSDDDDPECPIWTVAVECASHEPCDPETFECVCVNECEIVGQTDCVDDVITTCGVADGCRIQAVEDCTAQAMSCVADADGVYTCQ
jgi:hypothetical protein